MYVNIASCLSVDLVPSDSTKPHIRNTTDKDDSWNIVTVIVGVVAVVIMAALVVFNVVAFFVRDIGSLRNEQGLRYKTKGGTCGFFFLSFTSETITRRWVSYD